MSVSFIAVTRKRVTAFFDLSLIKKPIGFE